MLNASDILILLKKIIVGVLVFLVPVVLITGSLIFATKLLLSKKNNNAFNHKELPQQANQQ